MIDEQISVDSRIYLKVPIETEASDPTQDEVFMALLSGDGSPSDGDFNSATWLRDVAGINVSLLVGPGGAPAISFPAGDYWVWVKIVDDPEIPVIRAGQVRFF